MILLMPSQMLCSGVRLSSVSQDDGQFAVARVRCINELLSFGSLVTAHIWKMTS
jgi:hypothetical protein